MFGAGNQIWMRYHNAFGSYNNYLDAKVGPTFGGDLLRYVNDQYLFPTQCPAEHSIRFCVSSNSAQSPVKWRELLQNQPKSVSFMVADVSYTSPPRYYPRQNAKPELDL